LDANAYEYLARLIVERDDFDRSLTSAEIQQQLTDHKNIFIKYDRLYRRLYRELRVRLAEVRPMEEIRMEITSEQILNDTEDLPSLINDVAARFVFNIDEMWHYV
jgi:hypothetical protein